MNFQRQAEALWNETISAARKGDTMLGADNMRRTLELVAKAALREAAEESRLNGWTAAEDMLLRRIRDVRRPPA